MIHKTVQGEAIPSLGFGTWELRGNECREAVEHALEIGYRHIDTARRYENELDVGEAIKGSDIERNELFIASKVWHTDLAPEDLRRSAMESLADLGLDFLDLLMIHWPNPDISLGESIETMLQLKEEGLVRHLGVSNFTRPQLCRALELSPLLAIQVEYHPLLSQDRLLEVVRTEDMLLTAYAPLAKGTIVDHPMLVELGRKYGKTPAQVALRWLLQQSAVAAVPGTSSREHRESNFDIFDFQLTGSEMSVINALPKDERFVDPPWAPDWNE